jgi:hypothetical protein
MIWPLAYFRPTLRPQGGSGPLSRANVSNWRFAASDVAAPQGQLSGKPTYRSQPREGFVPANPQRWAFCDLDSYSRHGQRALPARVSTRTSHVRAEQEAVGKRSS